jgi:hypothetical protein
LLNIVRSNPRDFPHGENGSDDGTELCPVLVVVQSLRAILSRFGVVFGKKKIQKLERGKKEGERR